MAFDILNFGIRGTELQWFKTYLRGRQQPTTVSSFSSKNAYINIGLIYTKIPIQHN